MYRCFGVGFPSFITNSLDILVFWVVLYGLIKPGVATFILGKIGGHDNLHHELVVDHDNAWCHLT